MPENRSRSGDRRMRDLCHMSDEEFLEFLRVLEVEGIERRRHEQAVDEAMFLLNLARESGAAPMLH